MAGSVEGRRRRKFRRRNWGWKTMVVRTRPRTEAFAKAPLSGCVERRIALRSGRDAECWRSRGKTGVERLTDCGRAAVLSSNTTVPGPRQCRVVDPVTLRQSGCLWPPMPRTVARFRERPRRDRRAVCWNGGRACPGGDSAPSEKGSASADQADQVRPCTLTLSAGQASGFHRPGSPPSQASIALRPADKKRFSVAFLILDQGDHDIAVIGDAGIRR